MSETLFIADLHLHPARPEIADLFRRFLAGRAAKSAALYILGDLFEAWLGDDDDDPFHDQTRQALAELSAAGVALYFMPGNRDFLIGEAFAETTGCRLLPDPHLIRLHGEPTLLTHGDSLCTADLGYQAFRRQIREPSYVQAFLAKPLAERRAIAQAMRAQSREATGEKAEEIMDATPEAITTALRTHGARRLIHGHTHRPAIHRFELDGVPAVRLVLGDWYRQGSLLSCRAEGCELETLTADSA